MDDRLLHKSCWITGAGGLLGHALAASPWRPKTWTPRTLIRAEIDLTDFAAVESLFRRERPAAVIHCAALSKSPACQANPPLATQLNTQVTRHLAILAHEIPFFFFSTDLVFDGQQGNYVETDSVNPLSIYAETKVVAENQVLANRRHTVLRTSLNHGCSPTGDRGFNEEMVNAWRTGLITPLFTDEFRCPLGASVTARATWELLARGATGLFHLAGSERLSRWQIGQLLAERCRSATPRMRATSLVEYRGAPRSPDTSLNSSKAQSNLTFALPAYSKWLVSAEA